MYIGKDTVTSMQVDTNDMQTGSSDMASPEASENMGMDEGYTNWDNEPGFAPISPETPSWGPPSGSAGSNNNNEPGFAPISPETPSWGPPSGSAGGSGSSGGSGTGGIGTGVIGGIGIIGGTTGGAITPCPNCTPGVTVSPIVVVPGQSTGTASGMSNARFLYAATGQSPVNIRLGNRTVINRMQFGNSTPYYLENAGYQTVTVVNANTGGTMYRSILFFQSGTAYTFAIVNNGTGITLMQIVDMPCNNRNAACVRAVNLSPNSGEVDFFLSGIGRIFQGVDTFATTNYRSIRQGSYRASVSEALPCTNSNAITMAGSYVECNNTRIAVLDSANVSLMSGVTYTFYLIGLAYQLPAAQLLTLESDLVY